MIKTLKLLLPALFPSWRFFDVIAPSPRIEVIFLRKASDAPGDWREFRSRPARLSFYNMMKRLFFNAKWNDSLFLVSCSERLMQKPTEHSQKEIRNRIIKDYSSEAGEMLYMQYRLVFINRNGGEIENHVTFTSSIYRMDEVL